MPGHLERLEEAGAVYRKAEKERDAARERLRKLVLAAESDGVPLTKIARAAGVSRMTVRILAGR